MCGRARAGSRGIIRVGPTAWRTFNFAVSDAALRPADLIFRLLRLLAPSRRYRRRGVRLVSVAACREVLGGDGDIPDALATGVRWPSSVDPDTPAAAEFKCTAVPMEDGAALGQPLPRERLYFAVTATRPVNVCSFDLLRIYHYSLSYVVLLTNTPQ